MNPFGYTSRTTVENAFLNRTFPEISDAQFTAFISAAEAYINNQLGYTSQTTSSGILSEAIIREKTIGKVDPFGNLVVAVHKPPIHFDSNNNPIVTLLEFNQGGIRVTLNLTDGTSNALNTLLEVSENRRTIIYPSLYFFPAISTVTPTAKVNLMSLKDVKFWVDVSYVGGFSSVPADLQLAANYLVAESLTLRDNPNFSISVRQGQYQRQFRPSSDRYVKGQPTSPTLALVDSLLQPYKRMTW